MESGVGKSTEERLKTLEDALDLAVNMNFRLEGEVFKLKARVTELEREKDKME